MSYTQHLFSSIKAGTSTPRIQDSTPHINRQSSVILQSAPRYRNAENTQLHYEPSDIAPSTEWNNVGTMSLMSSARPPKSASGLPHTLSECYEMILSQRVNIGSLTNKVSNLENQLAEYRETILEISMKNQVNSDINEHVQSLENSKRELELKIESQANLIAKLEIEKHELNQKLLVSESKLMELREDIEREKAEIAFRLGRESVQAAAAVVKSVVATSKEVSPIRSKGASAFDVKQRSSSLSGKVETASVGRSDSFTISNDDAGVSAVDDSEGHQKSSSSHALTSVSSPIPSGNIGHGSIDGLNDGYPSLTYGYGANAANNVMNPPMSNNNGFMKQQELLMQQERVLANLRQSSILRSGAGSHGFRGSIYGYGNGPNYGGGNISQNQFGLGGYSQHAFQSNVPPNLNGFGISPGFNQGVSGSNNYGYGYNQNMSGMDNRSGMLGGQNQNAGNYHPGRFGASNPTGNNGMNMDLGPNGHSMNGGNSASTQLDPNLKSSNHSTSNMSSLGPGSPMLGMDPSKAKSVSENVFINEMDELVVSGASGLPPHAKSVSHTPVGAPPTNGYSIYQHPAPGIKWPDSIPFFAPLVDPGILVLKHGRSGWPKKRLLWLDISIPNDPALVWHEGSVKDPAKVKAKDRFRLLQILSYSHGQSSDVLRRSGNAAAAERYFSFATDNRTLDLEFPTEEFREFFQTKVDKMFHAYTSAFAEKLTGNDITLRVAAILDGGASLKPPPKTQTVAQPSSNSGNATSGISSGSSSQSMSGLPHSNASNMNGGLGYSGAYSLDLNYRQGNDGYSSPRQINF